MGRIVLYTHIHPCGLDSLPLFLSFSLLKMLRKEMPEKYQRKGRKTNT
jgi:hypothetical protein